MQVITICVLSAFAAVASATYGPYANQPSSPSYASNSGPYSTNQYNAGSSYNTPNNDYILSRRNVGGIFDGASVAPSPYGGSPSRSSPYQPQPNPFGPSPASYDRSGASSVDANSQSAYASGNAFNRFFGPRPSKSLNGPDSQNVYSNSNGPSPYNTQLSPSPQAYNPSSQQQPSYGPSPSYNVGSSPSQSVSGYVSSSSSQQQSPSFTVGNASPYAPSASSSSSDNSNAANNVLSLLHTPVSGPQGNSYNYGQSQNSQAQPQYNSGNMYNQPQDATQQPPTSYVNNPSPSDVSNINSYAGNPNAVSGQNQYSNGPSSPAGQTSYDALRPTNSGPSAQDASGYNTASQRYESGAPSGFAPPTTSADGTTRYGSPGSYQPQQQQQQ